MKKFFLLNKIKNHALIDRQFIRLSLVFMILLTVGISYAALDARYDDYDGYPLIAAIVSDGKFDLALEQMQTLSSNDKNNKNLFSYWSGVIYFKKGEYKKALENLSQIRNTQGFSEFLSARLYLARTNGALAHFGECTKNFSFSTEASGYSSEDVILHANCSIKNNNKESAWKILTTGLNRFHSMDIMLFIAGELNDWRLAHLSTEISLDWLVRFGKSPSDYLNLADVFTQHNNSEGRLKILELGRVRFPLDTDLSLNLTQVYFEKGMLVAAEEGFSRASTNDSKYAYHAAEINRQLGHYERSQYFNSKIPDEEKRLKQKLAIYVDRGDFGMIASLEPVLQRTALINNDEIRYALAYSLVRSGEYKRPLQYLAKITSQEFIEKTVILRNALSDCVEKNKVCKL